MSPILLNGKKFHFRCYSLLMGDMSAYIYDQAFLLTAGFNYDLEDADVTKHITNLSVNKKFKNHPGQIPCQLANEYPWVWLVCVYACMYCMYACMYVCMYV